MRNDSVDLIWKEGDRHLYMEL